MAEFIGNITEPEMRFSQTGMAILSFRLPVDKDRKNRDTGEFEKQYTSWWGVTLFGEHAENAAPLLHKGTRVVITGTPRARGYETKDGGNAVSAEIDVDHIGIAIPRKKPNGTGTGAQRPANASGAGFGATTPPAESWAATAPAGGFGGDYSDTTPF